MENLSTILSHLMTEKGISSAELARKTGVGQPVIYRIMTGATDNPQVLTLKPIAKFFGVSLDQLLGLSPLNHRPFDKASLNILNTKLITIKTIASALVDLIPSLIEGYKQATASNMIKEEVPAEILPLLPLNTTNLLKGINQLQDLITDTTQGDSRWQT